MDFPEIPGYTIKSRLGKGGMATIYLAEQTSFKRLVALKVMLPHLSSDPSFAERFMREARTVAQMVHRNFVPVYEVGQHDGHHYMSMEYLPAGDLKSHMRAGLALSDGIQMIKEVASALNYAAQKNFIHRDIKPENIMLREDLSAVVCDFGIAKEANDLSQMTMLGAVVGSPRYMSPEQAQASVLDGRSDLYSLGIIFFEMLAGHVPYDGGSAVDIAIKHVNEPIPLLPEDKAVFQPFIDVALSKDPEYRFQNGKDMIAALEELEETQYAVIQDNSVTVLMSEDDLRNSSHRSRTGSTRQSSRIRRSASNAAISGSTQSGRIRRPNRGDDESAVAWGQVTAISVAAILTIGATGWWLYSGNSSESTSNASASSIKMPIGSFAERAQQLRESAESALAGGRLYGPGDDNAQSYLTTLLVLAPEDTSGRASITRLYGMYLEHVSEELENGNLAVAQKVLDQASQISFYISDADLVEQQSDLRRSLMDAQQQVIIASERERQIQQLLAEAEELKDAGKLTSPLDDNAYDRFQEVLSLAPSNESASKGIEAIAGAFLTQAREQLENGQVGRANAFLAAAVQIYPQHPDMANVRDAVKSEEIRLQDLDSQQQTQITKAQEVERAKRDKKRHLLAEKVQSLLAGALEDIKADRLSSPNNSNAIEKYNQVLELDPANIDALNGLENVANRHVDIALGMIQSGQLDDAEWNLAHAKVLSPINPKYTAAQSELIAVRDLALQRAASERARNKKIALLFSDAELAAKKGDIYLPRGNNALETLRQILELDRQHKPALALRNELNSRIQTTATADIKARRFNDARIAIDALASNNASEQKISALRKQLEHEEDLVAREAARVSQRDQEARDKTERERVAQEKATADKAFKENGLQQRQTDERQQKAMEEEKTVVRTGEIRMLLTQASALGGPTQVTGENYRELADLYAKVQRLAPNNAIANRGISIVSDYAATRAGSAITAMDYRSASELIDYLRQITPGAPTLIKLREDLEISQRRQEQANEMLTAADVLTATPYQKPGLFGNNDKIRKTLQMAFAKIQLARGIDAKNPSLAKSEQKLVKKYADIINLHLSDKDLDGVRGLVADLASTGLGSQQLTDIQERIDTVDAKKVDEDRPVIGTF